MTEAQLDAALREQMASGKQLGRILIEMKAVDEADVVRALARQVGIEFVDLNDVAIDAGVVALVSETIVRRYQALPIGWDGERLIVAMADPSDPIEHHGWTSASCMSFSVWCS